MKLILMFTMLIALFYPVTTYTQEETNYQPITTDNAELLEEISVFEFDVDNNANGINQMMFHPSDSILYSLEFNETIRVWDIQTLEFVGFLDLPTEYATSFVISSQGDTLLYGGWDFTDQPDFATLNLWDISQEENNVVQREGNDNIDQMAFNSSGDQFAVAGWDDYSIRLWNIESNEMIANIDGHSDVVTRLEFVDDSHLISSSQDGTVNVWDLSSFELLESFDGFYFVVNPSNRELLVLPGSNAEFSYMLVNLDTLETIDIYEIEGAPFAFNRSGDVVAVINDIGEIWLHDFESGTRMIRVGANSGNFPPPIAFSVDDRYLALPSLSAQSGSISIWAVSPQEND